MHKLILQALLTAYLLLGSCSIAVADIHIYSDYQLNEARKVYQPNIIGMYREDLVRQLPAAHRQALANVQLHLPLRGKHPLQFHARPWDRSITVPIMSVKFLDELTILWAWFEENNCDASYITSYLSSLLGSQDMSQGPLQAFGLSMSVIDKPRVNSLSLKLSKSALYFLLAHEAGHLLNNHQGGAEGLKSRLQEKAADDFALSAMARVGVVPAGMLQYFIAAYMFEPLPDLNTWEYAEKVIGELTHPLASSRVRNIAQRLAAKPMDFAHSEPDPQHAVQLVNVIASQISAIANHMDHGGLKLYSASWLQKHYPKSRFAGACPM